MINEIYYIFDKLIIYIIIGLCYQIYQGNNGQYTGTESNFEFVLIFDRFKAPSNYDLQVCIFIVFNIFTYIYIYIELYLLNGI